MRFFFIIGLLLGGAFIWHKGLYDSEPWANLCGILAVSSFLTVMGYFFIKFLMSASGFVFKLLVIAAILFACYHGGKRAVFLVEKEDNAQNASFTRD